MNPDAGTARTRAARPPRLRTTGSPRPTRRGVARTAGALALPVLLAATVTAAAPGFVTVAPGDTLSHIAARHGVSVADLQRINGLGNSTRILAGQDLRVDGPTAAAPRGGHATGTHRIAAGETLSHIALRYGVSQRALASANGLGPGAVIYAGRTLVVPGAAAAAPAASPAPARAARGGSPATSASRAEVRQIIRDTAARFGVDPSLPLAIAHQESGFQQGLVSHADAIGVMQVLPTTVEWMEQVVGRDLDPYDVRDNVTAGVALIKVLRSQASVDDTIAAYYQGLRAVREHGWYGETRQYVANVRALQRRHYS